MVERDFEANPYTPHEERVSKYLDEVAGIGGGDDPVEFLIASHRSLITENKRLRDEVNELDEELETILMEGKEED